MLLYSKQHSGLINCVQIIATTCFIAVTIIPLCYAVIRLQDVIQISVLESVINFFSNKQAITALKFTMLEASVSTVFTVIIGLPVAWYLGRYRWKNIRVIRALLAMPFVTPSIVVAMGFLMLIDVNGPLNWLGIDLRLESGLVANIANTTGWVNPGHFAALIIAHVWFNISLIMRFIEPMLATMDKTWEEQLRFLPSGRSKISRLKIFWLPILGPALLCASLLCFIFSFSSFALVRWLTPNQNTLETLMANSGGSAGIYNYRIDTSEIVLSTSIVQLVILSIAIVITTNIQRKHANIHDIVTESSVKSSNQKPSFFARIIVLLSVGFALLPLILIVISSFRVRHPTKDGFYFTTKAWREAWSGDYSITAIPDALGNSLLYCFVTLCIALPVGWTISSYIARLEREGKKYRAKIVEVSTMIPLALSAVMIGLGILLGLLKWSPNLFSWVLIPALPHIIITTPFVIRIMLPAIRSIDYAYYEQAIMLGLSPIKAWWHGKVAFLRAPIVVSGALAMAFSLGEFGASWILVRSGSWDTLSVLIDQLMSQPKFDPLVQPMAMAAASVLMMLTFVLFFIAEHFRTSGEGSGF